MSKYRVGEKSKNDNRVDSFIWHLGVVVLDKDACCVSAFFIVTVYDIVYVMSNIVKLASNPKLRLLE